MPCERRRNARRYGPFLLVLVPLIALSLGACADQEGVTDPIEPAFAKGGPNAPPTSSGRIFFSSFMTGNWDLYSVNPDGTDMRRLTFGAAHEKYPAVSPDGKKLVYLVEAGNDSGIWTMNVDGSRQRLRLSRPDAAGILYPATWTPDGRSITFSYQEAGAGPFRMATMGVNAGDPVLLPMEGRSPTWSPDGRYLAYMAIIPGEGEQIVTSRPDGTDFLQRTSEPSGCCGTPQWSPDGGRILYQQYLNGAYLFVLFGVTSSSVIVTPAVPADGGAAAWSPDGTRIVYDAIDGTVRVMYATGGGNTAILEGVQANFGMSWSR